MKKYTSGTLTVLATVAIVGCGGKAVVDGSSAGGQGSTSTGTTTTSTTTTSTATSTSTSTSTSTADNIEYRANLWLGGMDHLIIARANHTADTCLRLFADWPMPNSEDFAFDTPSGWGVAHADAHQDASICFDWEGPPQVDTVQASGGEGLIEWDLAAGNSYPCTLDIDATISFDGSPPWLDALEPMSASGVVVDDGCF